VPPTALADLVRVIDPTGDVAALKRAFASAWKRVRAAHPMMRVDEEAFARHLARHRGDDAQRMLASAHVADLYLALGCGMGDPAALAEFERTRLSEVPAFVAHLEFDAHGLDELLQGLRARLLAPRPDGAKILHYGGHGPLGGWLRVAAVRLALTSRTAVARSHDDDPLAIASVKPDPELLLLRLRAGQAFKSAFEEALASLDPDQRTVLRMHYVDGLTIDEIGVAYAVHRATAARWIASGRDRIAIRTRRRLREKLSLNPRDLESVLRLVDSHLDLSLHRVLGGPAAVDEE
jgi:RNA polymerase sigma-70 factor (ECF subfamily)